MKEEEKIINRKFRLLIIDIQDTSNVEGISEFNPIDDIKEDRSFRFDCLLKFETKTDF